MNDNEYLEAVLRDQTLAPGSPEMKDLQERRKEVEQVLRDEFGDAPRIREGGSKAKGTMIKESYDLDLTSYFAHDDDTGGETLEEIYDRTDEALEKKYATTRKGSAIRVRDSKDTDLHVDVVPGRFVEGKKGDVFLHRTTGDKERLKTNLDVHVQHVKDSGVIEAIRLMKLWREREKIKVKTFVLELLVVEMLVDKKDASLTDQLRHVWTEFRDNPEDLKVVDPANREGNDLSDLLNDDVRSALSDAAGKTLDTIKESGWPAVFGEVEEDEEERTAALKRIAVATPSKTKPWTSGGQRLVR